MTHDLLNVKENLKIECTNTLVPSLLSKNKRLALAPENLTKSAIKLYMKVPHYLSEKYEIVLEKCHNFYISVDLNIDFYS